MKPSLNRRQFLGGAALAAPGLLAPSGTAAAARPQSTPKRASKPRRTMYFNDARHYYLYAFEPPMTMEDAWRPVDELVGDLGRHPDLRRGNRRRPVQRHQGGRAGHVADAPLRQRLLLAVLVQHAEPDRSGAGPLAGADRSGPPAPTGIHHQHAHGRSTQGPSLSHWHQRFGRRRRRPPGEQHRLRPSLGQGHTVLLDRGTGQLSGRRHRIRFRLYSLLFQAERGGAAHTPDDRPTCAACRR